MPSVKHQFLNKTRVFRRHIGKQLVYKGEHFEQGTTVDLLAEEEMIYDHRDQEVLRGVDSEGREFFVLVEEI